MKHTEGKFRGVRDMSIYFQYWEPEESPRAVILLVHGAGEHSSRYEHVAQAFVSNGFAVAALDHPNHGKSEGRYGHVDRLDDISQTLEMFHRRVNQYFPTQPMFLLGHSMGGLISSLYLLQHQQDFVGCILSGPAIKSDIEPGLLQMTLIKALSALVPTAGVLQLDANGVSSDPAEVDKYVNDPLVNHGKMTARKVAELFVGMDLIQRFANRITLPMLILHGEADPMTSVEGSRFLHQRIGSKDNTLKIYPKLLHEIFNETEREQVLKDILDWCDDHLQDDGTPVSATV